MTKPDIYKLIQKYDKPGPRYTSYPPATFFNSSFGTEEFIKHVKDSNYHQPRKISFYFHVPFCPQLCHFCGCNTDKMRGKSFIDNYIDAIIKEFEYVTQFLDKSRLISQIHWGGGTPNSISMKYIERVMQKINANFGYAPDCEIAMECNPAYLTFPQVDELANMGFNRLSIGIQDFNPEVLNLINRKPSLLNEEELIRYISGKNIQVNLDFVYGLPGQTSQGFANTIDKAIGIAPQRIVTFSYAHVPWVKSAQKILEQYGLPDALQKLTIFETANDLLTKAGYVSIGLDHFAKPGDELAKALAHHQLHRNFMGYCSRQNTGQVYAFGATSISQLWNSYSQNIKSAEKYMEAVNKNGTAIEKGYSMSKTDLLCNAVIQEIMCNQYVDLEKVASEFSISVMELFETLRFNADDLDTFIVDNLVKFENNVLTISPAGKYFLRNIAMVFDPLLTGKETHFSKTL